MTTPTENHNRRYAVPDRILLATDLDDADHLLTHAIAQAQASDAELTIAHVIPAAETLPLEASAISSADVAVMNLEATEALEDMAAGARSARVTCNVTVRQGFPQVVIPELVTTTKADRLILGTHARQHLKKLLLGSVAQDILGRVDVPVCTIGPHVPTTVAQGKPQRILHPVSLRMGYEQSARLAMEIAQFYQADITLLHVLDRGLHREYETTRVAEWTRSELQKLVPDEALLWTYVNAQIETGRVEEHILKAAAEMEADLVVLGTDPLGSFWPVRGDLAYGIIAKASCPVLTIKHSVSTEQARQETGTTTGAFAGIF